MLVALVGSAAITLTVLYLTHGITMTSTVAVLGTGQPGARRGAHPAVSVSALGEQHHGRQCVVVGERPLRHHHVRSARGEHHHRLVGVLDDVTVTQANIVAELARPSPTYRVGQLYRSASRVGQSHIASVVNTIVLAYAGASLPLLILVAADNPRSPTW